MSFIREVVVRPIDTVVGKTIKSFNLPVIFGRMSIYFPHVMTNWELGSTVRGNYEKNERNLVKKHIKKNDRVLELGACIGVVSISINRILSNKNNQVSIEPNTDLLPYLKKNMEKKKCNFHIENIIVSKEKQINFYRGGAAFLSSSIKGNGEFSVVKGMSLEEIEQKYFPFTALVMDIEGAELNFFRSFDLGKTMIRKIIFETHVLPNLLTHEELDECYQLLTSYGFKQIEKINNVEYWRRD